MPKSRTRSGSTKNVAASSSSNPPVPLLDCLLASNQTSRTQNNDMDNSKVLASGWECSTDDWTTNNGEESFPRSLRSIEKKNQQAKNKHLQFTPKTINEYENKIDILKLSSIVNDLLIGRRDQSAYTDFLLILQQFSVRSIRNDNLEETVYHLIQAAVSFIRANEQRFDTDKLEQCYRHRHDLKTNSIQ